MRPRVGSDATSVVTGSAVERAQGRFGGALLRFLLGLADPARVLAIADVRGDLERLVVIGPLLLHHRVAHVQPAARGPLLQPRLEVVQAGLARRGDALAEQPLDHGERRVEAAVEVDGGDERLAGVGEHRGLAPPARLLFAAAEEEPLAEAELAGDLGQAELVDDAGAGLGQLALVALGRRVHEQVPDDEVEDGVAEELEPLVVGPAPRGVLVEVRLVRQRALEAGAIAEDVAEAAFERRVGIARRLHVPTITCDMLAAHDKEPGS